MTEHFFGVLDQVLKSFPFADLNSCGKILSAQFLPDPQPESNEVFSVYITKISKDLVVAKAELRANFPDMSRCQLINLDLRKALPLTKKNIDFHLKAAGVSMGLSRHDTSQGTYVAYKLKSGKVEVRIGFTSLSEQEIHSISIDNCNSK